MWAWSLNATGTYVGEKWECGVCVRGGRGGGAEGGEVVSPQPSTHARVESTAWMARWGLAFPPHSVASPPPRLGPWGRVGGTPLLLLVDVLAAHVWHDSG